jgi:hypothetical protein
VHQFGTYAVGGAEGTRKIDGGCEVAGMFVIGIGVVADAVAGVVKIGP